MSEPCPTSSSESTSETEDECPNKRPSNKKAERIAKTSSDPALYDVSPRLIREIQGPCDNYRAAMYCRMRTRNKESLGLESIHRLMHEAVGTEDYEEFHVMGEDLPKPAADTLLMRRIMEMLDMKNKVLLQQTEIPKVFNKVVMSQAASKFQGALEAAEAEMVGIHDLGDAEMAATIGATKFHLQNMQQEELARPKITIVGYIGCYNDKEEPKPRCKKETKSQSH